MSFEGERLLTRGRIPHLRRPVISGGGQALPVGAERHGGDLEGMSLQDQDLLTRCSVPYASDRLKQAGGGQAAAIRAEGDAVELVFLSSLESQGCLSRGGIPHLDRPVIGGGGQTAAVGAE